MTEQEQEEWTVLWIELRPTEAAEKRLKEHKEKNRQRLKEGLDRLEFRSRSSDVEVVAIVRRATDAQIRADPRVGKQRTEAFNLMETILGIPEPETKDRGKARFYSNGGSTNAFAWMDSRPPPARFLIETAERIGKWAGHAVVWPEGKPT